MIVTTKSHVLLAGLASLALLGASPYAHAQAGQPSDLVNMNIQGADLETYLLWLSKMTGSRFIYDNTSEAFARRKINFMSPEPIPASMIFPVSRSLLEMNGFALLEAGDGKTVIYKVVETTGLAGEPTPILSAEELQSIRTEDRYVTLLVRVKHLKSATVANSLRQAALMSGSHSKMVEVAETNALLISDFAPNVDRVYALIQEMDVPPPEIVTEIVGVRYAKVQDIIGQVREILSTKATRLKDYQVGQGDVSIAADTRTASLIIQGRRGAVEEAKALVQALDREIPVVAPVVRIYRLQNAKIAQVVPVLRDVLAKPPFATADPAGTPSVLAQEERNAIIVTAPESLHVSIDGLIRQLDLRPPQVLIETAVVEFTASDDTSIGIELLSLDSAGDTPEGHTRAKGLTQFGLSSLVDQVGSPVTASSPGIPENRLLRPGVGLSAFLVKGTQDEPQIPIVIQALQRVADTRILNAPRLLTNDNESAEISIAEEVPVAQLNILNETASSTSFQQFVPAGTQMTIKPSISEGGHLRLEISLTLDSFLGAPPSPNLPPPKTTRKLKTNVTVPDGSTIILGGFTARREIEAEEKVPILGDIPVLGLLFRTTTHSTAKSHIFVFITPRVMKDPDFGDLKDRSIEEEAARNRAAGEQDR